MFGVNWLLGLGEEAKNRFSRLTAEQKQSRRRRQTAVQKM